MSAREILLVYATGAALWLALALRNVRSVVELARPGRISTSETTLREIWTMLAPWERLTIGLAYVVSVVLWPIFVFLNLASSVATVMAESVDGR